MAAHEETPPRLDVEAIEARLASDLWGAHRDVPALLSEVRRLRKENERLGRQVGAWHGRCLNAETAEVALKAERDMLKAAFDKSLRTRQLREARQKNHDIAHERDAAEARAEKLAEALEHHGRHASDCYEPTVVTQFGSFTSGKLLKCVCYIREILDSYRASQPEECECDKDPDSHASCPACARKNASQPEERPKS